MAKERNQSLPVQGESLSLAARLFIAHWLPNSGYTSEGIANQCLDAAEDFERVQRERAGQIAEQANHSGA